MGSRELTRLGCEAGSGPRLGTMEEPLWEGKSQAEGTRSERGRASRVSFSTFTFLNVCCTHASPGPLMLSRLLS